MEARAKGQSAVDAFKLAMVAADPVKFIPVAFPEWGVKRDDEITTKDLQQSEGEWKFEQAVSREEIEATLADLMRDSTITLSGDDLEGAETEQDTGWDDE